YSHDICRSAPGCPGVARHRSARPCRAIRAVTAHHAAHGSQRRHEPRQRRFTGQARTRARQRGHRIDRRGCDQFGRWPRCAAEGQVTPVAVMLLRVVALLATSVVGVGFARSEAGRPLVYGASLIVTVFAFGTALSVLVGGSSTSSLSLPLGLPWLGAHFRIDALAAFFLV